MWRLFTGLGGSQMQGIARTLANFLATPYYIINYQKISNADKQESYFI
jgi:hypothetical protein